LIFSYQVATEPDFPRILAIQHEAFLSEAISLNDYTIDPLVQTLDQLRSEAANYLILKAVNSSGEIVGSIRGREEDGTVFISKLSVDPAFQGRGVGLGLLSALESTLPAIRFTLFTSTLNLRALALYQRHGYLRTFEEDRGPKLKLVHLVKIIKPSI
jgi:ribosomal protein S18 acetylase RimI-like enzyme